jgi:hypothetical protein
MSVVFSSCCSFEMFWFNLYKRISKLIWIRSLYHIF